MKCYRGVLVLLLALMAAAPMAYAQASAAQDKGNLTEVQPGPSVVPFQLERTLSANAVVYSVAFSPDSRWLASASADGTVKIWDSASGQELRTLTGHTRNVYSVAFSPDGRWLASAGEDNTVKIWDVASGQELRTLAGSKDRVTSVAFSRDGRWLASPGANNTVNIWRLQ